MHANRTAHSKKEMSHRIKCDILSQYTIFHVPLTQRKEEFQALRIVDTPDNA